MKREVKFRALDIRGVWVYGIPVAGTTLHFTLNVMAQYFKEQRKYGRTNVIIRPETICQFTGLKDKKGKEIYEGDILQTSTGIASVVWEGAGWALKSTGSDAVDWENWSNYSAYEVIGNIYESNHELINYKETKDEYIFNKPQRNNEYI